MLIEGESARAIWRWLHFTPAELECHDDTHALKIDTDSLDRLERLREEFGASLRITSGYRTPAHNVRVSRTGPHGPHTTGRAYDIAVMGDAAYRLVGLAIPLGFTGIGIHQRGPHAGRYVHLDDIAPSDGVTRPWVWSY